MVFEEVNEKFSVMSESKDGMDVEDTSDESVLEICRLCMTSLTNRKQRKMRISHDIKILLETLICQELNSSSTHPRHICSDCNKKIEMIEDFKIIIKDSQLKIDQLINQQELTLKLEPFEFDSSIDQVNSCNQIDTKTHEIIQTEKIFIKIEPEDSEVIVHNSLTAPNTNSIIFEDNLMTKIEQDNLIDRNSTEIKLKGRRKNQEKSLKIAVEKRPKRKSLKSLVEGVKKVEKVKLKRKRRPKGAKNFECDICDYGSYLLEKLRNHIEKKHRKYQYCEPCKKYYNFQHFDRHVERRHSFAQRKCPECDKVFKDYSKLRYHYDANHSPKIICDLCGKLVPHIHMNNHIYNQHSTSTCDTCGAEFKGSYSLGMHVRHVHVIQEETCEICGKKYQNEKKLKRHQKHMHATKKSQCPVEGCNYMSPQKQNVKKHLYSHKHLTELDIIELYKNMKRVPTT